MNERNNFTGSRKFIIMSLLMPVLTACAVYLGLYLHDSHTLPNIISGIGYVLCYDFIFLFYLGTSKDNEGPQTAVCIISAIIPAVSFFVLYFGSGIKMFPIIAVVMFGMVTFMCAIIDFASGLILLAAIAGYTFLFIPSVTAPIVNILLYLFLACILVNGFKDKNSLLLSIAVSVLFYTIISLMSANFVMEDAFTAENIMTAVVSNVILVAVYFVKKFCYPVESEEELPTDKNRNRTAALLEAQREAGKAARQEISRLKEELRKKTYEYDKLQSRHEQVVASNNEFGSQMSTVQSEIDRLKHENDALDLALNDVKNNSTGSFEDIVSSEFDFIVNFKRDASKLYRHSQNIANISREAAGLIGCDEELAYIIGIYHEAPRFLGENYSNELLDTYHVPKYIVKIIDRIKDKNNNLPLPREAGIVMLTDDIISTSNYLKSKQNETVPLDRIVTNTIKVRKDQNVLRLAGFSNEEIQLLKLYYIESGGNNDTAD